MKSYKIRSLIYLGCFIAAGVVYYNMEQRIEFHDQIISSKVADLKMEDSQQDKNLQEEKKKEEEQLP
ncbi:MAG: hypothetical protein HKP38_09105 [Croceitalea sp.]|nr:hypothetical protein [Croceitalea sp.]NNL09367.1 hypothetical protein [Croceitalea sp.]